VGEVYFSHSKKPQEFRTMDPLLILIVLALLAAAVAMFLGILVMGGGGSTDTWLSNHLMWARVGLQGLTVLLLLLAAFLR
jgi:hypothetical protein